MLKGGGGGGSGWESIPGFIPLCSSPFVGVSDQSRILTVMVRLEGAAGKAATLREKKMSSSAFSPVAS